MGQGRVLVEGSSARADIHIEGEVGIDKVILAEHASAWADSGTDFCFSYNLYNIGHLKTKSQNGLGDTGRAASVFHFNAHFIDHFNTVFYRG